MIDFEWYRSFISIYKHRSVSAAAKARILTQPAMSQHLAALEAEIGEPLFIRAPRKMIPTDRGKELYTKIVPLIENLESVTQEIRHITSSAPLIRIGTPREYFTKNALQKLKNMDVRFSAHFGVADDVMDELQKDAVDLIITTQKVALPGVDYTKIEDETFVVTAPVDCYPQIEEMAEVEEWLNEQRWLSYGAELPIVRRYWRQHFGKRPSMQAFHIMPDLRAILEAIEQGMGISILPTYLIEDSVALQRVHIVFPELFVENTIYAAYKVENKDNPAVQSVVTALKQSRHEKRDG